MAVNGTGEVNRPEPYYEVKDEPLKRSAKSYGGLTG